MISFRNIKNKRAFTLAELLIVVAIIGILVAVSIPIFASKEAQAKEATCEANRRSLKALLINEYLTDDGKYDLADGTHSLTGKLKEEYLCPDGGAITYKVDNDTGTIKVYCSKHKSVTSFGNKEEMDKIRELFAQFGNSTIDSSSGLAGPKLQEFLNLMSDAGVNLDAAGTWQYRGGYLYFVPQTISNSESETLKYMLQYNFSSGNYTVWDAGNTEEKSQNGGTYYVLPVHGTKLQNKNVGDQTYEKAMEIYNDLMK